MKIKIIWLFLLAFFLSLASYLWFKNHNYLAAIQTVQSIAADGLSESEYSELPNLIKSLPGTRAIFTADYFDSLYGNNKVRRIYRVENRVNVDLEFTDEEDDVEKRSAKITLNLKEADLSNVVLFTSVQIRGDIIGKGHQGSRIQFELTDANNKKMMGPKILAISTETPLILRPTVTEPIPTGSFQDNFDLTRVRSLTIRFIVGKYPNQIKIPARGKLIFSEILRVTSLDLISRAFRTPDMARITEDTLNLEYELRRLRWKFNGNDFFVGINYPWNNYGWDVGKNPYGLPENSGWSAAKNEEKLRKDFTYFKTLHPNFVVRIYMFFDLRTGLDYTDGKLTGFDKYARKDSETIFKVAGETGIKLDIVLFDFGIADGQKGLGEHPELIFSPEKGNFLVNVVRPLLIEMEQWDNKYGKPVFAIELMNEPDNMAMLLIPGYFDSLKIWFKDLINIIHQETKFKVTLGSHSIVDMQRWWADLKIDVWQFHFYKYMSKEHEQWPQNLKRDEIKMPGMIFCGELEPYDLANNLNVIKANGYNGVLFWSWNSTDDLRMSSEQIGELSAWIESSKKTP